MKHDDDQTNGKIENAFATGARQAVSLETLPMDEDDFLTGQSKIGGIPHMPDEMEWPVYKGTPLYFLAQIALKELPNCEAARLLPEAGTLYFFHEGNSVMGFDPAEGQGFRVLHAPPGAVLSPRKPPCDQERCIYDSPCAVDFGVTTDCPPNLETLEHMGLLEGIIDEEGIKQIDLDSIKKETEYEEKSFDSDFVNDGEDEEILSPPAHKLLGWPNPIQGNIFSDCQLAANGILCGNSKVLEQEPGKSLKKGIRDWRLLLQLDSDENIGLAWGESGMLYFCIREDDLKNHRFDKTWAVLQLC